MSVYVHRACVGVSACLWMDAYQGLSESEREEIYDKFNEYCKQRTKANEWDEAPKYVISSLIHFELEQPYLTSAACSRTRLWASLGPHSLLLLSRACTYACMHICMHIHTHNVLMHARAPT